MRAYRVGFILTVSFLVLLSVICLTLGYMPAPTGPKAPEYPSYPSLTTQTQKAVYDIYAQAQPSPVLASPTPTAYIPPTSYTPPTYTRPVDPYAAQESEYQKQLSKYNEDKKQYDMEQKSFTKDKILPYAKKMFVTWLVILIVIESIGIIAMNMGMDLVGSMFTFTGVWAIIVGPVGGMMWFASQLVARFSTKAEEAFSIEPVLQIIGITALIGVIVLCVLSVFLTKLRGNKLPSQV